MSTDLQSAPEPSMASLAGGIVSDAQALIKQELALAKREIIDELTKAKQAAGFLGVGIVTASLGGLLVALMLVHLLHWATSEELPLWSCYGIVAAVLVILGTGLFLFGKRRVSDVHLTPEQTIATMKDNVQWFKNQT
jgi:drug/metabolite transporter (DMT)-like permease